MESYIEKRNRYLKEILEFPVFLAFTEDQFNEGLAMFGLRPDEANKVCNFAGKGIYILKDSLDQFNELMGDHSDGLTESIKNDKTGDGFIYEMFHYELGNQEFPEVEDVVSILESLGLTMDEVISSPSLAHGLEKAVKVHRKYNSETI